MSDSVLIVEQHALWREILQVYLEALTFEVVTARDAAGGIAALDADEFDLLFAGFELPDGSGLDFLAAVRKRGPDLPLFMISESWAALDRQRAESLGVVPVYWPCKWDKLRARIKEEMAKRGADGGAAPPKE